MTVFWRRFHWLVIATWFEDHLFSLSAEVMLDLTSVCPASEWMLISSVEARRLQSHWIPLYPKLPGSQIFDPPVFLAIVFVERPESIEHSPADWLFVAFFLSHWAWR